MVIVRRFAAVCHYESTMSAVKLLQPAQEQVVERASVISHDDRCHSHVNNYRHYRRHSSVIAFHSSPNDHRTVQHGLKSSAVRDESVSKI